MISRKLAGTRYAFAFYPLMSRHLEPKTGISFEFYEPSRFNPNDYRTVGIENRFDRDWTFVHVDCQRHATWHRLYSQHGILLFSFRATAGFVGTCQQLLCYRRPFRRHWPSRSLNRFVEFYRVRQQLATYVRRIALVSGVSAIVVCLAIVGLRHGPAS